jgi:hypothetical protein
MRWHGREARPANAAPKEMIDEASCAQSRLELASIRIGGPVTVARSKGGIAHERFDDQGDQLLTIDIIHPARIRPEQEQLE